jgi:peptidoglycan/LPS O-acetylase OafA/YrhL
MFLVGGLMAQHEVALERAARKFSPVAWLLIAAAAAFLITCSWTFHQPTDPSFTPLETLGAALVVVLFAFCPLAKRLGERAGVQWLGRISFSLYLIHEPIIVATAFALPQSARNVWLPLLIALPIVFAASWLFYRFVEGPSHRLSQRLARGGGCGVNRGHRQNEHREAVFAPCGLKKL